MKGRLALGVLLIVAGIVSAALLSVPRLLNMQDRVESFPRTSLSEGAVELERRTYHVYLDVPLGTGDAGWTLTLRDPAGRDVELQTGGTDLDYAFSEREGTRIGTVKVTAPGRHSVRGTGPPGARLVFGDEIVSDIVAAFFLAYLALAVLAGAGGALIVLALARRRPPAAPTWP